MYSQSDNFSTKYIVKKIKTYYSTYSILGNQLELALNKIGRQDIVDKCICNVELVTDDMEKALAKVHLDQSGFDCLKDELGPSRDTSLRRDTHIDKSFQGSYDEIDKTDRIGKSGMLIINDPSFLNPY